MTAPIIELTELTREFVVRRKGSGRLRERHVISAVDAMSWTVEPGESVGYIGANGAGKSTTIKMLSGILVPTSGSVRTCGLEPVTQRRDLARRIGVVFGQRSQLWWDLPLRESFTILAAIHQLDPARGDARTAELVEQLEMGETLDTPVRQLSLGQRMRAEIAAALLHSARAADPGRADDRARRAVEGSGCGSSSSTSAAAHGTTLLLTTHDMGDIERLCDRVLVVDHGRLVYDGTLPGLAADGRARERMLVVDLTAARRRPGRRPWHDPRRERGGGPAAAAGLRRRGDDRRRGAPGGHRAGRGARPVHRGARHRGRRPPHLPDPALTPAAPARGGVCLGTDPACSVPRQIPVGRGGTALVEGPEPPRPAYDGRGRLVA